MREGRAHGRTDELRSASGVHAGFLHWRIVVGESDARSPAERRGSRCSIARVLPSRTHGTTPPGSRSPGASCRAMVCRGARDQGAVYVAPVTVKVAAASAPELTVTAAGRGWLVVTVTPAGPARSMAYAPPAR